MKIYISHAALNDAIATRAHFALVNAGFETWVDHIYGQGSEGIVTEQDEKALRRCEAELLILSEAALASPKCAHEWKTILDRKKPLYVAVTEPIAPDDLPDRLWDRVIPYVDLQNNMDGGLEHLIHAIAGSVAPNE
jgi:TIR domain